MKRRFTVVLAAKTPLGLVQLSMEGEGARVPPEPLGLSEEERMGLKIGQSIGEGMVLRGLNPGMPMTIVMLDREEYRELGKPAPGDKVELSLKRLEGEAS